LTNDPRSSHADGDDATYRSASAPPPPPWSWRLAFAIALGAAVAVYVVALGRANPDFTSDFDQVWGGARALWEHKNPYEVVGPGREYGWHWPLYYPLPALVAVAPLGLLPVLAARALFSGLSAALFAWAITRDGWFRVPAIISVSFMVTMELGQWSALFTAAFFMPALGAIAFAKPNFGVALGVSSLQRGTLAWIIGGTVALLAVSQVLQPGWHESWLANLRAAPHFKTHVQRPFGFLLLLAALKWRRPEARWLFALAVIPQAPSFYDQLLLTVVCLTRQETLILAATTVLLFFYVGYNTPQPDYLAWGRLVGNGTLWICYLPMLGLVLMRPNEGPLPPVVERFLNRLRSQRE
jgi:hypothetical protein